MAAAMNDSSAPQQYCLKWNAFPNHLSEIFQDMLTQEVLVDVTLTCEEMSIKAHKLILSACSPYFRKLFMDSPDKHPIVILHQVKYNDLKAIIDFIYSGEVNIPPDQFQSLFAAAVALRIKGLSDFNPSHNNGSLPNIPSLPTPPAQASPQSHLNRHNNIVPSQLNPLLHSTPLANKILTMQNPAISNNLTSMLVNNINQQYNSVLKGLKRKRARQEMPVPPAPASLRNLSAINRQQSPNMPSPMSMNKLNKQLINQFVKAVPGASERLAAAKLFSNQFAKDVGVNGSAGGSFDEEEDIKNHSLLESNNNQNMVNKNGQFEGQNEFDLEPTKLLEQSMSTPEVSLFTFLFCTIFLLFSLF